MAAGGEEYPILIDTDALIAVAHSPLEELSRAGGAFARDELFFAP